MSTTTTSPATISPTCHITTAPAMDALYTTMTAALCQDSPRKLNNHRMRNFWPRSQYPKIYIYHRPCHRCPTFYLCAASSALENGDRDRSSSLDGAGSTHNIPGTAPVQSPEVRSIERPAGVPVELLDGGTAYRPGEASAPA
ncbi:uncharacterized protein K441DRAFT_283008 [Cenococcum geophilum 1.58]|uniref:uncharacterized protein n=1 Tax=Cenococcum geophilum 1.58 TaxID=794803 RepID=UPI0035902528|nr:hypothetical protein K441DRAFT_283008 [Cenococcum geophilum 1.58]